MIGPSFADVRLPPKADVANLALHVRFVPKGDICIAADLFDHLVGTVLKQRRHVGPKSLGGL
jgi:hypothetical protein